MQVHSTEQLLDLMVGAARFELATTCTPCRYATRLRYAPMRQKYIRAGVTIRLVSAQQLDDVLQLLLKYREVDAPRLLPAWCRGRRGRGACRCRAQVLVEAVARAADGEPLFVQEL